jgi:dephospho-CoA kinase
MIIIGLTGGIATGKSTVTGMFKQMNIPVIDADEVSRSVVNDDSFVIEGIERAFGTVVINPDGTLNRKELGKIVFSDSKKLDILNKIIQPAIRGRIERMLEDFKKKDPAVIVIDIPLLYEFNYESMTDYIIVVYVNNEYQIERLIKRDKISRDEAVKRIKSQMPMNKKMELADYVIDNSCEMFETQKQLKDILTKINIMEDINV